jgi:hypothetical protein
MTHTTTCSYTLNGMVCTCPVENKRCERCKKERCTIKDNKITCGSVDYQNSTTHCHGSCEAKEEKVCAYCLGTKKPCRPEYCCGVVADECSHCTQPKERHEPKPAGDWRETVSRSLPYALSEGGFTKAGIARFADELISFISRVESSALSRGREQGIREALGVVPEMQVPTTKPDGYLGSDERGNNRARQAILNLLPKE